MPKITPATMPRDPVTGHTLRLPISDEERLDRRRDASRESARRRRAGLALLTATSDEIREREQKRRRDRYQREKHKWLDRARRNRYGVTREDYDRAYQAQHGCCAICGRHQSELPRPLGVDHDHETGLIRGLLCDRCNVVLGRAQDSPRILLAAARYLEAPPWPSD